LERRATIKGSRLLVLISVLLLVVAAALFVVDYSLADHTRVFSVGDVKALPSVSGAYRSINRWKTVQNFSVKGVPFHELLAKAGVTDDNATVTVISPDGYFWPGPKDKLTVTELKRKNSLGLIPVIAYQMDGSSLDPEPDGTGPLRYVAPQYSPDEENKPSWVSNARVIQVGPTAGGVKAPDAKKVPNDEIWISGSIPSVYPFSTFTPVGIAVAGLVGLAVGLFMAFRKRGSKGAGGAVTGVLLCLLVYSAAFGIGGPRMCQAATSVTFSRADLESMPATSGHYTFLKQLPPYTYFEADYTGVALSYLLEQKLNLDAGASGVVVKCTDGFSVNLTLGQVNNTYVGGLKIILAYAKGGAALAGDEGPLRLIVPQTTPGNHDQGGDPNTPLCARMVNVIEVTPAAGVAAPGSVPPGSVAVFGSVTLPAPANPSPAPQTQGQATTTTTQQTLAQQAAAAATAQANAPLDAINRTFGDPRHMLSWLMASTFAGAIPGRAGRAFMLLYYLCGI
jgi:DMSO/TMAO reductase YedYZ molybdopterin-dependent catalytic subunit